MSYSSKANPGTEVHGNAESTTKTVLRLLHFALIILGAIVLVGWALDITPLKSILPGLASMKPNTALLFVLTGVALQLLQLPQTPSITRIAQMCALLVLLVGLLTLSEYVLGWETGVDQLLFILNPSPSSQTINRMSQVTAFNFVIVGVALLAINTRRYLLAQCCALLVLVLGLVAVSGYLFSVSSLYNILPFGSIALHTALAFCACSCAILLAFPQHGIMAVISQNYLGGVMARRLLPAVIIVPLVIGWLRLQGQYLGYYNTEFGLAVFAVSCICIFATLVWWTARLLNRIDIEHQQARLSLERYARRIEILHNIDRSIIASEAIEKLVEVTLSQLQFLIPCPRIDLCVIDEFKPELVIYTNDLGTEPRFSMMNTPMTPNMFKGFGTDHTRLIGDLRPSPVKTPIVNSFIERGLFTLFQMELIQDGQPKGIMNFASNTVDFFVPEYRQIAIEVGNQLAIAVKQTRLTSALQRANDTLEQRVTERTAELNAAKEQIEAIFDNSLDAILLTSIELDIKRANPAFTKLLAYAIEPDTHTSLLDIVHAEDAPRLIATVQSALAGVHNSSIEVRVRRDDGMTTEVEISIGVVEGDGLVWVIHDITSRKLYDRQLRYEASLQNTVADAVIATDLGFNIQSWNKAAESIYGWRAEEVIGRSVREILKTEFSSAQYGEELRRLFIENGHWSGEVQQHRRDGSIIVVLSSTVLFKDQNNVPIGVLAVNHDITERKQAEVRLRSALEREKELGELKTRFISVASHEFRTPLTAILMMSESLINYRHKLQAQQIDEKLERICQQVTHLSAIMDDVLVSAKMEDSRVDFKPIQDNLDLLCREIVQDFAERSEFANRIQYTSDNPTALSRFDGRVMRQIITNLLSNALKYSAADKQVDIHLRQQEGQVVLEVSDQGIGVPAQDLKHIFEPFHRAVNVGKIEGTGLGMSITKKAVELHGGSISVTSEPQQGTTFTVIIPSAHQPSVHDINALQ